MKSHKGVSPRNNSGNRQAVFLWGLIGLFICVAAIGWLPQPPSNEEMGGDLGRAYDWISAGFGRNGLWWTPAYLMGHSMSVFAVAFISQLCMTIFIFIGNLLAAIDNSILERYEIKSIVQVFDGFNTLQIFKR